MFKVVIEVEVVPYQLHVTDRFFFGHRILFKLFRANHKLTPWFFGFLLLHNWNFAG